MSAKQNLQKASIISFDQNGRKKEELKVLFNPEQYSIDKTNQFATQPIPGLDSPVVQFIRGDSEMLSVELFFDTYTYFKSEDVRNYTDKLSKFLQVDPDMHAPPLCSFQWGNVIFTGVIEKVTKQFTLFDEFGKPLRARVTLSIRKYPSVEEQNKPTHSPDKTKRILVNQGDSLWRIAAREYGDATKWRLIADANDIDNPRILKAGSEITVPPV
jgi:LysM repeat protein